MKNNYIVLSSNRYSYWDLHYYFLCLFLYLQSNTSMLLSTLLNYLRLCEHAITNSWTMINSFESVRLRIEVLGSSRQTYIKWNVCMCVYIYIYIYIITICWISWVWARFTLSVKCHSWDLECSLKALENSLEKILLNSFSRPILPMSILYHLNIINIIILTSYPRLILQPS